MKSPSQEFSDWAEKYNSVVQQTARKYSSSAEYDDLYQEGMIALWKVYPETDIRIVQTAVSNRMLNWIRYTKRLNYSQPADYDSMVDEEDRSHEPLYE
jgi:DNA-directed RNA polymerase specialized sigma24 family protein